MHACIRANQHGLNISEGDGGGGGRKLTSNEFIAVVQTNGQILTGCSNGLQSIILHGNRNDAVQPLWDAVLKQWTYNYNKHASPTPKRSQ